MYVCATSNSLVCVRTDGTAGCPMLLCRFTTMGAHRGDTIGIEDEFGCKAALRTDVGFSRSPGAGAIIMINYEIDAQGHELDDLLGDLRDTLRRISNFNVEDRRTRLRRCAEVLELKALDNEDLQKRYHEALKEKNAIFKNLLAELETKKTEIDREKLQAGTHHPCAGQSNP